MSWSFGIITDGSAPERMQEVITSIRDEVILEHELIVVGGEPIEGVVHVPHDETIGLPMWITRKKNLITQYAKYHDIVYMHDYLALEPGWLSGFERFGDDWDVCMTKMVRPDGSRYRDWALDPYAVGGGWLLPYDVCDLSEYQYLSGAYWCAKKHVMQEFPLDESLPASRGEDILWSRQVNRKYKFSMNPYSTVQLLKDKDPVFVDAPKELIDKLRKNRPTRGAWNGRE